MSGSAFKNIEESLKKHLPDDELREVKRILYGRADEWVNVKHYLFVPDINRLKNSSYNNFMSILTQIWRSFHSTQIHFYSLWNNCSNELKLYSKTVEIAQKNNFEVKGYSFDAKPEELRKPRIVRVSFLKMYKNMFFDPTNRKQSNIEYDLHVNVLGSCYSTLHSATNSR